MNYSYILMLAAAYLLTACQSSNTPPPENQAQQRPKAAEQEPAEKAESSKGLTSPVANEVSSLGVDEFSSPTAASCRGVCAAFDIGSESTKLRVYNYSQNKLVPVERVGQALCRQERKISYADDVETTGRISQATLDQAVRAIEDLYFIAHFCNAEQFSGVVTSAFRKAENSAQALQYLQSKLPFPVRLISQHEEAQLVYYGVRAELNLESDFCVWDIGGMSMQIICPTRSADQLRPQFITYLGSMASVPFKNDILKLQYKQPGDSPNPISRVDYQNALGNTLIEAQKIQNRLGLPWAVEFINSEQKLYRKLPLPLIGVGNVHKYVGLNAVENKTELTRRELSVAVSKWLDQGDEQLPGGAYVSVTVSNLILVEQFMKHLNIQSLQLADVNLTQGLIASPGFW